MVVILIHWLIKAGYEEAFVQFWEHQMKIKKETGLYREILTRVDGSIIDPKFHTFSIESPHYSTFINLGIWRSLDDFDKQVGKYIPTTLVDGSKQTIELKDFEFKIRERVVLSVVSDRGSKLPKAKLIE